MYVCVTVLYPSEGRKILNYLILGYIVYPLLFDACKQLCVRKESKMDGTKGPNKLAYVIIIFLSS